MNTLIVIPARGGSRGIKRKALTKILGKPLIWYSLDYVQYIQASSQSVVVTDDDEIERYVQETNSEIVVVREPLVSAENENSPRAVFRAVIQWEAIRRSFSTVTLLMPTQPVRPHDIVERCVAAIDDHSDSALTVHEPQLRPEFMQPTDCNGIIRFSDWRRRQDYDPVYCLNGVCMSYRREVFDCEPQSLQDFHRNRAYRPVLIPSFPYVDIDEPKDLELFRFLLENHFTMWDPQKLMSEVNSQKT
jgi:CMP-N,N'-diacetyllegionaminic acid synthase